MSGDVVTWAAMAAAIAALISIITFWTRYSDRITKADAKAAAALKEAEDAKAEARAVVQKAATLEAKLYQVEIWARDEFVRKASFESAVTRMEKGFGDLKTDIASRLDRMADRIDHIGHPDRERT